MQYIANALRHFVLDLISERLYDLVLILSTACLVTDFNFVQLNLSFIWINTEYTVRVYRQSIIIFCAYSYCITELCTSIHIYLFFDFAYFQNRF